MQKSFPYKLLHGPLFYQTVFRSGIRSPGDVFVINIQKSSVHLYQQRQFNIDERKFTYILRPGITPNRDYWRVVYHTNTLLSDHIFTPFTCCNSQKHGTCHGRQGCPTCLRHCLCHGEPEDLRNNLPILLNQDYPDYEIIVVNDGSDANSEDVLKLFSNEYKNLYYTYVPVDTQYLSHKKLALTMGIKAARHDILLFTEADCRPIGPKWIKAMAGSYNPETDIILGFCAYRHTKGFLHKLIAYDNLTNGLQMISSALSHHPFTGNGRNLSYRKKLFFAHKGYSRSLNLHAGADDLFINEVSNPANTQVQLSSDSIIKMNKVGDSETWREIKTSRAATKRFYKRGSLTFYRMETIGYLFFWIAGIATFIVGLSGNWLLSILAGLLLFLRFTVKALVYKKSALLLQQKPLTAWLPLLEIAQPVYDIYIHIYRMFNGKKDFTNNVA